MADNGCIGCNSAITQQNSSDERIINIAKNRAKEENITIGLYRNATGELSIADGPGYPITSYITPLM